MNARYRIQHETIYHYASPVQLSRQLMRLTPRSTPQRQNRLFHRAWVDPKPSEWFERLDYFGNPVVQFALQSPHEQLSVSLDSTVIVEALPQVTGLLPDPPWEQVRDWLSHATCSAAFDPSQYLFASPHVPVTPRFGVYANLSFPPDRPLLQALFDLNHRIHQDFRYDPGATEIATPVEAVLRKKRGVCQDFAHLMLACLRARGLAARYVSGYLLTHPTPGKPRLIGADASHAWVAVYCPRHGWIDIDPTNDCWVGQEHITVAWGRDFSDVSPLRGVILGGENHELTVRVTVTPELDREELLP